MAAAEKLFLANGVEATTISSIVEEAKVAKGTFYHYFAHAGRGCAPPIAVWVMWLCRIDRLARRAFLP
ncbi:hypothetical protein A9973_04185 [Achromobacter sp. UMC46]|nr:hypothetical protein [Achromobacter sp. UMC46]